MLAISSPSSGSVVVPLAAAGFTAGGLMLSTSTLNFANTAVGAMSTPLSIMVTNMGATDTGPITAEWSDPTNFAVTSNGCAGGLLPSTTCTIEVRGTPTTAGQLFATLRLQGASAGAAMLTGNVNAAPATGELEVDVSALSFPPTQQGANPPASRAIVRILNRSTMTLTGVTSAVTGTEFTAPIGACATVAAQGFCNLNVNFKPIADGARTATLTLTAGTQTKTVTLNGTGSADTTGIRFTALADFGIVNVSSSDTTVVTISNTSGATITLGTAIFMGGPFSQTSTTCGVDLTTGNQCSYTVRFQPTVPGPAVGFIIQPTGSGTLFEPLLGIGRGSFNFTLNGSITLFPPPDGGSATCSNSCSRNTQFNAFTGTYIPEAATMPAQNWGNPPAGAICPGLGRTGCALTYPLTGVSVSHPGAATISATVTGSGGFLEGPSAGILCPPICSSQPRAGIPIRVVASTRDAIVTAFTCNPVPQSNICEGTSPMTASLTLAPAWSTPHAGADGLADEATSVFIKPSTNGIYATGFEGKTANGTDLLFLDYTALGVKTQALTGNFLTDDRGQDVSVRADGVIYTVGEQGAGTANATPVLSSWTAVVPAVPTTLSAGATPSFGINRVASTPANASTIGLAPTMLGTDTVLRRWDMTNALTASSLDPRRWTAITPSRLTDHAFVAGSFMGDIVIGKVNNTVAFDWTQTRLRAGEDTAVEIALFPTSNNILVVANETVDGRGTNVRLIEWNDTGLAELATATYDSGPDSADVALAAAVDANGQIHVLGKTGDTYWIRRWARDFRPLGVIRPTGNNLILRDLAVDGFGNVILVGSEEVTGQRDALVRKIGP